MGSTPGNIFRIVVKQGLRVTGAGLILGAVTTLAMVRLIQSLLFGIQSTDLRVMGAVAVILTAVGLVACIIPARRATNVDPVAALTQQ
jgi:ABC-type lipoprotein release transport system permease subunit